MIRISSNESNNLEQTFEPYSCKYFKSGILFNINEFREKKRSRQKRLLYHQSLDFLREKFAEVRKGQVGWDYIPALRVRRPRKQPSNYNIMCYRCAQDFTTNELKTRVSRTQQMLLTLNPPTSTVSSCEECRCRYMSYNQNFEFYREVGSL